MGKKDKNKKKGKGAEKTAEKTKKKTANKQKKALAVVGEDNIENIIAEIEYEDKKRLKTTEHLIEAPARRINFTLVSHPYKEELILFGGEFFDGQKTFVYNDLIFYNITNNTWTVVNAPAGPPPRCGHQMIVTPINKGQLWLFGGEFASPTQSQFYHYRDLWMFDIEKKQWEKITSPNGPTARSGHRMVYNKRQIFVFGGFHDNLRDYKYFNDVYIFNLDTYQWTKLDPSGIPPAVRSGCCMMPLSTGKILIYGGYNKERIKKDVDSGFVHTDSFLLMPEKNDTTGFKWKWVQTKIGGLKFPPRCGLSVACAPNDIVYVFGGVYDKEDEENLSGEFFNDLFCLDLEKLVWKNVSFIEQKTKGTKCKKSDENKEYVQMEIEENITTVSDDGIFKVTVGPSLTSSGAMISTPDLPKLNIPSPRMNCGLVIKRGILFLYGGMFEDGDKQVTLNDFHSLDIKKPEEWKTIKSDDLTKLEWFESDSESNQSESESDENSNSDKNSDNMDVN